MDFWRARIADQAYTSATELAADSRGEDVILFTQDEYIMPWLTPNVNQDEVIIGTIYRDQIKKKKSPENDNVYYYEIVAWIEWEDHLYEGDKPLKLEMKASAFEFL
jgi:hypothetical protein